MAVCAALAIVEVGALLGAVDKVYALALRVWLASAHGLFREGPEGIVLRPADPAVAAAIARPAKFI